MTSAVPHALGDIANVGGPDGCIDAIAAGAWLNTAVVQKAIHVDVGAKYFGQWSVCSNVNCTYAVPPPLLRPQAACSPRV